MLWTNSEPTHWTNCGLAGLENGICVPGDINMISKHDTTQAITQVTSFFVIEAMAPKATTTKATSNNRKQKVLAIIVILKQMAVCPHQIWTVSTTLCGMLPRRATLHP